MRKLILLITTAIFYISCSQNNQSKGVIPADKMVDVLFDMQVSDAALNQVNNVDTMKMQAHTRYNYVFHKYNIDSATFTKSLKYYSRDAKELDTMYAQVSDSLKHLQEIITPKPENRELKPDLASYVLNSFKIDTSKSNNNLTYYTDDVKVLYNKYLDDLKPKKDTLNTETIQFKKMENLN